MDGLVACRSHCGGGNDGFQPSGKSMSYGGYGTGKACGAAGRSRMSFALRSRGYLSLHSDYKKKLDELNRAGGTVLTTSSSSLSYCHSYSNSSSSTYGFR